jgi:hypothetical protein
MPPFPQASAHAVPLPSLASYFLYRVNPFFSPETHSSGPTANKGKCFGFIVEISSDKKYHMFLLNGHGYKG